MFIAAVIYLLLALLAYFLVKFKWFRPVSDRFSSDVPPGSLGWPFIGDYLSFLLPQKAHYMSKYFLQHYSRYGHVFKCSPFGVPTIVSCDLELNNFILQNEGILFANDYPKPVREALGEESVIFTSGPRHKKLRSLVVSVISTSNVSPGFISYIEKLSIIIMDTWRDKKEIIFYKEAQVFMLYYVLKRVLDVEIGDEMAAKIEEDIFTILEKRFSYVLMPSRTHATRVKKARTRIRQNLTVIISEKKQFTRFKVESSNDEDIVNVVLGLLMSIEPNASLMTLVVYFLGRSPRAIHELKTEHESMSLEDHKKMEFTLKVINETLRCGNVTKYVYRKALKDIRYKGYLIPSGWRVIPFITGTHLNPSLHEEPFEFNPWRWDYNETKRKVIPFGGGLKICPGAEFAKHSVALFLHHFVLNFKWKIRLDHECPELSGPFMGSEKELVLEIEPCSHGIRGNKQKPNGI